MIRHTTEEQRLHNQLLRAQHAGREATLTLEQWLAILDHHQEMCAYCKAFPFTVMEHLVPIHRGGGTTDTNCVPACTRCNHDKGLRIAFYASESGGLVIRIEKRMVSAKPCKQPPAISQPIQIKPLEEWIKPDTAAKHLSIATQMVKAMAERGEIDGVMFSKRMRIRKLSVDMYMETHKIRNQ